ncbi:hypothetical protein MD484_g7402, partial [Candolleomyces efflorescens]
MHGLTPAMDSAQWQGLLLLLRVDQDQGYSKAASLTFLICDICSTFYDEVRYIWRRNWTFTKVLYLLARYYGLFLLIAMLVASSISDPSAQLSVVEVDVLLPQRYY